MSTSLALTPAEKSTQQSVAIFAAAALAVMCSACLLAGWAPLGFSIVTVFLFAGPHNWLEARYFMSRMPARWGPLRSFFLLGIGGTLLLGAASALLPSFIALFGNNQVAWDTVVATWNTCLVAWILCLVEMRSRKNPRRDWGWIWPIGWLLVAASWLWPAAWSLMLVYAHPLVALWFLDRELGRRHSSWRASYRWCLVLLPLALGLLWWRLAAAPNLPGEDLLTLAITRHAGGGVLSGISTHLLVATHTFLEMLHYCVWVVAIPLVGIGTAPWRMAAIPLVRRSFAWHTALAGVLAFGGLVTVGLWAAFAANYPLTRDIYFTVAVLHVLAEVPFLLRLL